MTPGASRTSPRWSAATSSSATSTTRPGRAPGAAACCGEAGIAEAIRDEVRAGPGTERRAALALARKRGFGPFGSEIPDRERRHKQIAAMLRAGHPLDSAREMVDAASEAAAEQWAAECEDDES